MALGRLVLRLTVGGLMAGHGLQKLRGDFGGPGLKGTEEMMRSLDMHPAKQQAMAVAVTETVGGALTALGLFSPIGPAMISGSMATAIKKVHAKNGIWVTNGGFEYNLVLLAASFALAADGPGLISLDALFRRHRSGIHWGLLELGLALGAAAGNLALAERLKPSTSAEVPPPSAHESAPDAGSPTADTGGAAGAEASSARA